MIGSLRMLQNTAVKKGFDNYQTYDEERSWEGYRIIWIHSSKENQDRNTRERQISKAEENLEQLLPKFNEYYLKSKEQIEKSLFI